MTYAIAILMLLGYIMIATEHISRINKAATAMFVGVVGWILFMCTGNEFITRMHGTEFQAFLQTQVLEGWPAEHQFIANNVFLHHSTYICSIVMYLLSCIAIMDVLVSNGCFDFISLILRSRSSRVVLWGAVGITFLISANLDNLLTTVMMLMVIQRLVSDDRCRLFISSAVVIAANCGGLFTVIGDVTSLMVWTKGAVTPTTFSSNLIIPAMLATFVPTALIARKLPETVSLQRRGVVYDGDDYELALWQRVFLLLVGLGGLWFVPTFYRITMLPPFLGSLCVLVVLWVANDIFHGRYLFSGGFSVSTSQSHRLMYETLQVILFFVGVTLSVSVLVEIGVMHTLSQWCDYYIHNTYILSAVWGFISAVLDNVALLNISVSMYDVMPADAVADAYHAMFTQNGAYWQLIMLSGLIGGCLLPIGNTSGYALMRMEGVSVWWYFRHITGKVMAGWIVALLAFFFIQYFF